MRVIYIDTLFLLNLIVDYFLLRLTAAIGGVYQKKGRLLLGATVGACFAVLLFFPPVTTLLAILLRASVCCMTVFAAFGRCEKYQMLRLNGLFLVLTLLLAGIVFGLTLWRDAIILQNGVPYFDISITVMGMSFTMIYALSKLVFGKGRGNVTRNYREITVVKAEKTIQFRALSDSGNLLQDPVSGKRVLILQAETASALFEGAGAVLLQNLPKEWGDVELAQLRRCCKTAFWLLPVHTAVQDGMLPVFRPDALFLDGKPTMEYVIGLSAGPMEIGGDCRAVIGVQ